MQDRHSCWRPTFSLAPQWPAPLFSSRIATGWSVCTWPTVSFVWRDMGIARQCIRQINSMLLLLTLNSVPLPKLAGVTFQTPTPLLFQIFESGSEIFQVWESDSCSKSGSLDATETQQCLYLSNDIYQGHAPVACRGLAMPGAAAWLDSPLPNSSIEHWRTVVIVTGYTLFVTSQYNVIFTFAN